MDPGRNGKKERKDGLINNPLSSTTRKEIQKRLTETESNDEKDNKSTVILKFILSLKIGAASMENP